MKLLKRLSVFVLAFALLALTACVPSVDKAEEKMKDAGYTTISSDLLKSVLDTFVDTEASTVEKVFFFGKDFKLLSSGEWVVAVYYKETADAKEAYEKLKEDDEDTTAKRSGKCVYYGSEQGMKDFK